MKIVLDEIKSNLNQRKYLVDSGIFEKSLRNKFQSSEIVLQGILSNPIYDEPAQINKIISILDSLDPYDIDIRNLHIISTYLYDIKDFNRAIKFGKSSLIKIDQKYKSLKKNNKKEKKAWIFEKEYYVYSLFGKDPIYYIPIVENLNQIYRLNLKIEIVIYYDDSVDSNFLDFLDSHKCILIKKARINIYDGLFWRFNAFNDFDNSIVHIRDADSLITEREIKLQIKINEMLKNDKKYYALRDNILHLWPILAGLWGGRSGEEICLHNVNTDSKFSDQIWLAQNIWAYEKKNFIQFDRYYEGVLPNTEYLKNDSSLEIHHNVLHFGAKAMAHLTPTNWLKKRMPSLSLKPNANFISNIIN